MGKWGISEESFNSGVFRDSWWLQIKTWHCFHNPKTKNDIYKLFLKGKKSIKKICLNKSFPILSKSTLCMSKGTKQTLRKNWPDEAISS